MAAHPYNINKLSQRLASDNPIILDGALATYLEVLGADISNKLWSAEILMNRPSLIKMAHLDYFRAGANIAITASYQASLSGLIENAGVGEAQARDLVKRSVMLAKEAGEEYIAETLTKQDNKTSEKTFVDRSVQRDDEKTLRSQLFIAGSIGPYGAYLANGAEYTGEYKISKKEMKAFHCGRIEALVDAGVDILACETMPSKYEVEALLALLQNDFPMVEAWFSFTLRNSEQISDGTPIAEMVSLFYGVTQIVALGFNCVPDDVALGALITLRPLMSDGTMVLYPNSGESWNAATRGWEGHRIEGSTLATKTLKWYHAGARLIGGCCRTTPKDIGVMREALVSIVESES